MGLSEEWPGLQLTLQGTKYDKDDLSKTRLPIYKVDVMQEKVGVDPKVLNDVELIALVRETQEELEAHGE
jgi:hypothetical protein